MEHFDYSTNIDYTLAGRVKEDKESFKVELILPREQILDGVFVPPKKIGEFVYETLLLHLNRFNKNKK